MIAPTVTDFPGTRLPLVRPMIVRERVRTITESSRLERTRARRVNKPESRPRNRTRARLLLQAMRSVNALETQKRENVADAAKRIGFRLYNHLVHFPPSVVVPDCNFTLPLRKMNWIVKLLKTLSKIVVTQNLTPGRRPGFSLFSMNDFPGAGVLC